MAGGEAASNTADNTQELAELFDATLKFTSVLKKKGVSQSTLTVSTALKLGKKLMLALWDHGS